MQIEYPPKTIGLSSRFLLNWPLWGLPLEKNHMTRKPNFLMVQSHAWSKPKLFVDSQGSMLHRRRHRRSTSEWFRTPGSPVSGGRWNCVRAIVTRVGLCKDICCLHVCMHVCIHLYVCMYICMRNIFAFQQYIKHSFHPACVYFRTYVMYSTCTNKHKQATYT